VLICEDELQNRVTNKQSVHLTFDPPMNVGIDAGNFLELLIVFAVACIDMSVNMHETFSLPEWLL